MTARLTPEYEAAIRRVASLPADAFGGVYRAQITALLTELAAVRAELAHAVPHAREKALKEAARLVENHVPDDVFARLWNAADDANSAANAALDKQQGAAS